MKDINPEKPSLGLGDSIAKFTHALGIDVLADTIAKAFGAKDCGCERRRELLNKLFPYGNISAVDYTFTESTPFLVLESFESSKNFYTYKTGEVVYIDPFHELYPQLKDLLQTSKLIKI